MSDCLSFPVHNDVEASGLASACAGLSTTERHQTQVSGPWPAWRLSTQEREISVIVESRHLAVSHLSPMRTMQASPEEERNEGYIPDAL